MTVTFIDLFQVQPGHDEALWRQVNDHMRTRAGYQDHRLHRALRDDATHRYASIATWEPPATWQAAHDEQFRALVSMPAWREFPSSPCLYELAHADDIHDRAPTS